MARFTNCNIHIPDKLIALKQCVEFHGFLTIRENNIDVYVYAFGGGISETIEDRIDGLQIQTETVSRNAITHSEYENFLIIENTEDYPKLLFLKIRNEELAELNTIILIYNYGTLLNSEAFAVQKYPNNYSLLSERIKLFNGKFSSAAGTHRKCISNEKIERVILVLCKHSTLCAQIKSFFEYLHWIYEDVSRSRKVTVKSGNMILALLIDLLLGIFLLNMINKWCYNPSDDFMNVIETIVNNLRELLEWLMGAPAGLKLNHAFNNTLGKFFLYHIEVWWMFIAVAKNMLDAPLGIFKYVGVFGVTFQSAMLADFLTLASLHIYCIYVYAARLYNMQVTGLTALWRLFLGKKKNPLRGRVDSCQYTHQQLFIGMLAFTILLFLLPTTALYYIVFTVFRVLIVILSGILTRIRYFVSSLPLYVLTLWLIGSPKIASNVQITVLQRDRPSEVVLGVSFTSNPVSQLIDCYRPEKNPQPATIEWIKLISSLWMGELIYPV